MRCLNIMFLLIAVLSIQKLTSQVTDIDIDWGPISRDKDMDFDEIVGTYNNMFFAVSIGESKRSKNDFSIRGIDMKTKAVKFNRTVEDFEFKGEEAIYEAGFVTPAGKVVLYFNVYDNRNDRRILIYRELDSRGKMQPAKELTSVPAERKSEGSFEILTSRDSSLMAVYGDIPADRKENEVFKVQVLDRDHNEIWNQSIVLPYTNKYFTVLDQALTNKGELFILGYSEPDRSKGERKSRNSSNKDYKLYRLAKDEDIVEFDLNLDEKYVSDASIHADYFENMIAIPGFYSDSYEGAMKGAFFFTVNQSNLEVITSNSQAFSKEFMMNFMSEKRADKGKEIGSFDFMHFIRREDGGAVVVAERNFVVVTQHTNANGGFTTHTTYHSHDIIVVNINPEGDIEWSSVVPKKQALGGRYYLSHMLMVDENRLHFIYNDNQKNIERYGTDDKLSYMSNVKKSMAIIATVENDGSVSHDLLFHNKSYKALLVPRKSYQVSNSSVILFAVKKDDSRFGTMHLN